MKERVKKILKYKKPGLIVITISILMCLLSACFFLTNPIENPSESKDKNNENSNLETIQNSKAEIKYPQFLTEVVSQNNVYKEALNDENAVITINYNIITSPKAVKTFFDKYNNKESCKFNIYFFYEELGSIDIYTIIYDKTTKELYKITKHKNFSNENIPEGEEYKSRKYILQNISLTDYGFINYDDGESSEPVNYQVISDYDIFDDYDKMISLTNKYAKPIYMPVVRNHEFDNVNQITDWIYILEQIVKVEAKNSNEDFWTVYPEGKITVDEMMKHLNKYFEVDKQTVLSKINKFMIDENTVEYLGGLGGAYPEALVYDMEDKGDISVITCRFRSVITGNVDMNESYIITVKNMSDGTFRYLSMKKENR